MKPYTCKARDLRLGDVVRLSADTEGYVTATVIGMKYAPAPVIDTLSGVTVFRPYVHVSDMVTSDGVIPYVGFEQFDLWPDSNVIVVQESSVIDVRLAETDEGRIKRAGGKIERTASGGLRRVQ